MKFLSIFILLINFSACSQEQQTKKYTPNAIAKQLSDSAVTIGLSSGNYEKPIALLDQATQIDSNYHFAYWNKLSFQAGLGRFNDALAAAKNLVRIKPESPESYVTTGGIYWKLGDSTSSINHFNTATILFDKIIDTMSTSNKMYETVLMNKAVNLIFLGQEEKGNKILNDLYQKQKDLVYREMLGQLLNKSRDQILNDIFKPDPVSDTEQ